MRLSDDERALLEHVADEIDAMRQHLLERGDVYPSTYLAGMTSGLDVARRLVLDTAGPKGGNTDV